MTRRLTARVAGASLLLVGLGTTPSHGEQTRSAAATPAEIQRGQALGVAVTSRGRIFLAPRMTPFGKPVPGSLPTQVFAATADSAGNVFLATGPDGELVKIARGGEGSVAFHADEPLVTAVALFPNGEWLAASAPGGKIYKLRPDGKPEVWCETGERYVWALVVNPDGSVLAATGDRGRLLKIDRNGKAKVVFDADEAHLVSLAPAGDGAVWAGGSARGLVYHVDADGHAFVAYGDELPEAKAIVVTPRGELVVAFDAPPISDKRPPALRLRMAGGTTGAKDAMTDLESHPAPTMQGVIEGMPAPESDESVPLRGKIVRIAKDGVTTELWRSRSEAPFALTLDGDNRPVFATGEPAKLWRVEGPDEIAVLATLPEGQATAFAGAGNAIVAATSNPAASYRVEFVASRTGTFTAPPADAGSAARWGTIDWRPAGSGGHVELATRTGNCEAPDGTWSAWSPPRTEAKGSPVANPDGRFLQWRATLSGSGTETPGVNNVTASYATQNRPPSIRDLRVEPQGGAINAKATIRWSSADPDGDGVTVDVSARPVGTTAWKSVARIDPTPAKPSDPTLGNDGSSKDGKATWDTANWDEGLYEIRAVASDQPSNPPQEGLQAESTLPATVSVDRTPPSIDAHRKGEFIVVAVDDALSGVAKLEVVTDGRVAFSPRCADGVCDGRHEEFRFEAAQLEGGGAWILKATDAAGNAVEAPVPGP